MAGQRFLSMQYDVLSKENERGCLCGCSFGNCQVTTLFTNLSACFKTSQDLHNLIKIYKLKNTTNSSYKYFPFIHALIESINPTWNQQRQL